MAKILEVLNRIKSTYDDTGSEKAKKGFKEVRDGVKETQEAIDKSLKSLALYGSKIATQIKNIAKLTDYTDKYVTSQKVLNNTFGSSTDSINGYMSIMSKMTGVSDVSMSKQTSLFGQMSRSMGMTTEMAQEFSQGLDTLSSKLSLLYNIDYERASKSLLDAAKGESSTLTTLTGIVVKTQSLQNTLDRLNIGLKASDLSGANLAMLQYITIADQVNVTNRQLTETVNDVAWQKKMLTEQVKNLATSFGNLLYPVLKLVLPPLNALLIVLTNIINILAKLVGFSTEIKTDTTGVIDNLSNSMGGLADNTNKAVKASLGLRSFDKINNLKTPTPTTSTGGGGLAINKDLYNAFKDSDKQLLDIKNKAQEIADSIMDWLGFTKDENDEWQFSQVKLGTIIGLLVGGGGILIAIKKIWNFVKNFGSIGGIIGALLGGKNKGLNNIGSGFSVPSVGTVLKGLADLTLIIGGLTLFATAVGDFFRIPNTKELASEGVEQLVSIFTGLGKILIPIAGFSAIVGIIGSTGGVVMAGLGQLVGIIVVLEGVFIALGTLYEIPNFQGLVNGGIQALGDLFEGLGVALGKLVGGIGEGIASTLPAIGAHLSKFMENAQPFFDGTKNIDESSMNGIKSLAQAILILTASDILEGLTSWLTGGDTLEKFGAMLPSFGENLKRYSDSIKGINASDVETSANSALLLAKLENNLPPADGKWQKWFGSKNLQKFGAMLPSFGTNLRQYANNIKGINASDVETSANAALSLAKLSNNLPEIDGKWQKWFGEKNLEKFGAMLPSFGKNYKEYANYVKGIDNSVVTESANAAKSLSELANGVPTEGGFFALFTGEHNISEFGKNVADFGKSFKEYFGYISNISVDKVSAITNSVNELVTSSLVIKDRGIDGTLKKFADNLKKSSNSFNDFFSKTQASTIGYNFGSAMGDGIISALRNKRYPTISLKSGWDTLKSFQISAYKDGGFPEDGIFYANHNELVGGFDNGKTAVANNFQIVDGIKNGVKEAMYDVMSAFKIGSNSQPIYNKFVLGDDEMTDWILQKNTKLNRQYGLN